MKEGVPQNITEEKLAKFFAGEASREESQLIRTWANLSQENKDLLLQMQILWIDTGHIHLNDPITSKKYDVEAAWAKVRSGKEKDERQSRKVSWIWKVAAGLVLFGGAILLLMILFSTPDQVVAEASSSTKTVQLPDGSSVFLNRNSQISYAEDFEGGRDVVLHGEAYFEVEHDPLEPFTVSAGPTQVKVLGTSFYVDIDDVRITTLVKSGRVQFAHEREQVVLTAGEKSVYSMATGEFSEKQQDLGTTEFWRTKTLRFAGHKLPEVVQALEKVYGVDIELSNDGLRNCSLSVTFQDDSLDNVLEVISVTLDVTVDKTDENIVISGKGCVEN